MPLVQIKLFGDLSVALSSHQPSHCSFPLGPNCSGYKNISKSPLELSHCWHYIFPWWILRSLLCAAFLPKLLCVCVKQAGIPSSFNSTVLCSLAAEATLPQIAGEHTGTWTGFPVSADDCNRVSAH